MTALVIILAYLALLLVLGLGSNRLFRGTASDYMLASHTIGPFLLLMSLFGTTMTAFALVGSTGKSYTIGVGVYPLMASSSGIVHSLCFFLIGTRLWSLGRRHGYSTQVQFFRDRLESDKIGLVLFPVLVCLVIPYLLIGVIGGGAVVSGVTAGAFESSGWFADHGYGVPPWLASLVICCVVLVYVFFGGMRGTAWANAFQTTVFMLLGVATFVVIARGVGGEEGFLANLRAAAAQAPEGKLSTARIPKVDYFGFLLIPLSVGMFPHVFQHWLTARSAATFKVPIVAHPLFIMVVWAPCVLIGVWAAGDAPGLRENQVLGEMVRRYAPSVLGGLLTAGILAAIMSSLDSQFLCLGTMFTNDIAVHYSKRERFNDRHRVLLARGFIIAIVTVTYLYSLVAPRRVFDLGIWCFSGFTSLVPLVVAALYWRRLTAAGAYASVLTAIAAWGWLFYDYSMYMAIDPGTPKPPYKFFGLMPIIPMTAASTAALVAVSLATRPPSPRTLARFFGPAGPTTEPPAEQVPSA